MSSFTQVAELLLERAADRLSDEAKRALSPVAPYLRRLGIGAMLVLLSGLAWFATFLFFLLTLFLYLGGWAPYALAALYTGIVAGLLAFITLLIGLSLVRRPR